VWSRSEKLSGAGMATPPTEVDLYKYEIAYLQAKESPPSVIYPASALNKDGVNTDLMAFCSGNAANEFFSNDCGWANRWVTKKENKGKKDKPNTGPKGVKV